MTYKEYISSPEWAKLAQEVKRRRKYECALDPTHAGPVEAHHRSYRQLGHEAPEDIILLCEQCHRRFHHRQPPWQSLFGIDKGRR